MRCHSHTIAVICYNFGLVALMTQEKGLLSLRCCMWSEKNRYCEYVENEFQERFSRVDECFAHDEF